MNFERRIPSNKLLAACFGLEFDQIFRRFSRVDLPRGRVLHRPRIPIEQVYFIETGLVAVAPAPDAATSPVCAWLIANEGFTGLPVLLGALTSPHRQFVLTDGTALSISTADFRCLLAQAPAFRRHLLLYTSQVLVESAQTCACNARHRVENRVARFLLTAADRLQSDELPLTHGLVAQMLGIRRATTTEAMHLLAGKKLVSNSRGSIHILDRPGLSQMTCRCYHITRRFSGDSELLPVPTLPPLLS